MSNVGGTSWGASLPQQPVGIGRKKGPELEPKPPGKQPPAVVAVQKALVEHLQRAYPILDGSIVQLIVEDQGEDNIDEAVKVLSSLAADAEKEAAASRYVTLHICFARVMVLKNASSKGHFQDDCRKDILEGFFAVGFVEFMNAHVAIFIRAPSRLCSLYVAFWKGHSDWQLLLISLNFDVLNFAVPSKRLCRQL
jgi:hypothetical protein